MKVLKKDSVGPWVLDEADETWLLAKGATITSDNDYGIDILEGGTTLRIAGKVRGDGGAGVHSQVDADDLIHVSLTATAKIVGFEDGIYLFGAAHVENYGTISVEEYGVFLNDGGTLTNHGSIIGRNGIASGLQVGVDIDNYGRIDVTGFGVSLTDPGEIRNRKGAEISSDYIAIWFGEGDAPVIRNDGVIRGKSSAIYTEHGIDLKIVNHGLIVGQISLGDGNDTIDTRGGQIRGSVEGGEGDDTYWVSSTSIRINEQGSSFGDVLHSSVSYSIDGTGLDNLYLSGRKDISAKGNEGSNILRGNGGDNFLNGLGGEDFIIGGRGDDRMRGGGGSDIFQFKDGGGTDTILDFEDGVDWVELDGFKFGDARIRQKGDDVWLDFDGGDRLILRNFEKADFTVDDMAPT